MQLVLRGADSKIRATFTDPDGAASIPTNPKVTITRDSDGAAIVTAASCTDETEGVVGYTISGDDIPEVDLLTASWTADDASAPDSEVEVVGGFLCSLEAINPDGTASSNRRLREQAELWIEDACGCAFRPRYKRDTVITGGTYDLLPERPFPQELFSLTIDGTDVDLADVTVDGIISRTAGFCGTVSYAYSHGFKSPPEAISRATIKLAQWAASGSSDRITRFSEDQQEFYLTVGGVGGALTSVPEVNAAIEQYRIATVG